MKRWECIGMKISMAVISLGGLVYAYLKYFYENPSPFSVVNHPWEPFLLHLHVLAAPVMIFFVTLVLKGHVMPKIVRGDLDRKKTGWIVIFTLGTCTLSGYLLQVVTSKALTAVLEWVHLGTGVLFFFHMIIHMCMMAGKRLEDQQALAFYLEFQDMDKMDQAVEERSGKTLTSKHLDPVLKCQIGCDDPAGQLVPPTVDFEE